MRKVAVILDYKIHNKSAYNLINNIFVKVLNAEYTLYHLVPEFLGEDDYYKVSEKDYKAKIKPPLIEEDIVITLGSRCSKFYTGEPRLLKSINQVYLLDEKKVYPNYSPLHILNNYSNNIKQYVERINNAIEGIDLTEHYTKFKIIESIFELNYVLDMCIAENTFCFDFETTGLLFFRDLPTILSISFNVGYSYILPLFHFESKFKDRTDEIFKILKERIFENKDVVKYGHNIKFDLHFILHFCKCQLKGIYHDSMLMHHLLDENAKHGLKELTKTYYSELAGYEENIKGKKWAEIPLNELSQYAAIDTDVTLRLCINFEVELMKDERLYMLYRNYVCVANLELLYGEHHGALIDKDYIIESITYAKQVLENFYTKIYEYPEIKRFTLHKAYDLKFAEITKIEDKINSTNKEHLKKKYSEQLTLLINTGIEYKLNLKSPKQLTELLYSKEGFNLPLVYDRKQKKEVTTTSKKKLRGIDSPFLADLFELRTVEKLVSTYYEGILSRLDENNYLHTSFLLHGTKTGRLSSKDPNLQNIPVFYRSNNEEVKDLYNRVKKFFITPQGYDMLCCDFSQAELRCIANFSQDKIMIDAYLSGSDLHSITAASIAKLTIEEYNALSDDEKAPLRRAAKDANFGYAYGCSPETYKTVIFETHGKVMDIKVAEEHRRALFDTYLGLNKWHSTYIKIAQKYGYVRTLLGRKRRLININNETNHKLRAEDERYAINSPIQGTSGEWTVFTICLLCKIFSKRIMFFNNIHDAMYFYSPKDLTKKTVPFLDKISSYPLVDKYFIIDQKKVTVPMKLDIEYSDTRWSEKKPI